MHYTKNRRDAKQSAPNSSSVGPPLDSLGKFKVKVIIYYLPVLLRGRRVDFMTSKGYLCHLRLLC